jgi:hypothetical protein
VALFIGGIITSLLLFTVVQLLQTNQREAARSDTQREIQMALDYIARDLREAVYVYDGKCLPANANFVAQATCPGILGVLPSKLSDAAENNLPVLAFWRVDPLPQVLVDRCTANAASFSADTSKTPLPNAIKGVPCISKQMYTLVVYSLNWKNSSNTWRGNARIERYQLPQFTTASTQSPPVTTPGWSYPASRETDFYSWPYKKALGNDGKPVNTQVGTPVGNSTVLVDFVDKDGIKSGGAENACPQPNESSTPQPTDLNTRYIMTPSTGSRGFYVCVKGAASNGSLNQEVVVRIQGNAAGRPGLTRGGANIPIPMETRVLTRGVVNKV